MAPRPTLSLDEDRALDEDQRTKEGSATLTDCQRSRIFACICVARHINGASDNDDKFTKEIYADTWELMEPHMKRLELDHKLSYHATKKIWTHFVETELVLRQPKVKPSLRGATLSKGDDGKRDSHQLLVLGVLALSICLVIIYTKFSSAHDQNQNDLGTASADYNREIRIKHLIDDLRVKYPGSLKPKQLRATGARLDMMSKEVSMLLLVGGSRDSDCDPDPTLCIAEKISSITNYPLRNHVDASNPHLNTTQMNNQLSEALDHRNDVVMIDNLDKLPGGEVMNLFQFIDRIETNKRRKGLLLMTIYTAGNVHTASEAKLRDAELVERILIPAWSKHVRSDTLTSVISRISGTIVRVK